MIRDQIFETETETENICDNKKLSWMCSQGNWIAIIINNRVSCVMKILCSKYL